MFLYDALRFFSLSEGSDKVGVKNFRPDPLPTLSERVIPEVDLSFERFVSDCNQAITKKHELFKNFQKLIYF